MSNNLASRDTLILDISRHTSDNRVCFPHYSFALGHTHFFVDSIRNKLLFNGCKPIISIEYIPTSALTYLHNLVRKNSSLRKQSSMEVVQ